MEWKIGKQIQHYRKQKGLTQEQLAGLLNISNQAVSKWELDQSCPDIQLLPQLADLFEVTLDTLFGREHSAPTLMDVPWEDDGQLRAVLFIGHTLQTHSHLQANNAKSRVEFHYDGPALSVISDFSVCCENCTIYGSVHAADGVCCGNVSGSVHAGDGVQCGDVGGDVQAGDSVACGSVGGNVLAGDGVTCGDVGGNVRAGGSIHCAAIHGDAHANDLIHIQN